MYLPTMRSPWTSPPAATVSDGGSVVEVVVEVVVVGASVVGGSVVGGSVVEVVGCSAARVVETATAVEELVPAADASVCDRSTKYTATSATATIHSAVAAILSRRDRRSVCLLMCPLQPWCFSIIAEPPAWRRSSSRGTGTDEPGKTFRKGAMDASRW